MKTLNKDFYKIKLTLSTEDEQVKHRVIIGDAQDSKKLLSDLQSITSDYGDNVDPYIFVINEENIVFNSNIYMDYSFSDMANHLNDQIKALFETGIVLIGQSKEDDQDYLLESLEIEIFSEDILNPIYTKHWQDEIIIDMELNMEIYNEFLTRYKLPSCSADELNIPFSEDDEDYDKYNNEIKNNLDDVNLFVSNYIDLWESQDYYN